MNRKTWPTEDREDFDQICKEAWASATSTRERTERFLELLHDADQAHRIFAKDALRHVEFLGGSSILKTWRKAQDRVAVAYNGEVISKSRVAGVRRVDPQGVTYVEQTLFDFMNWGEIEEKVNEYVRQRRAYEENIHVALRLLQLRDLAPGAKNPTEACLLLGTTVEAFLAEVV